MNDESEHWSFRYFDKLRNRWLTARYKATKEAIAKTYEQYELIGEPEIRKPIAMGEEHFRPWGK